MSDLSRRVAEACGWRTEQRYEVIFGVSVNGHLVHKNIWRLIMPDGSYAYGQYLSESEAWAAAPDYEHDVAAGIEALEQTGKQWTLRNYEDMTFRRIFVCEIDAHEATGESPALAICAALLAWSKARET